MKVSATIEALYGRFITLVFHISREGFVKVSFEEIEAGFSENYDKHMKEFGDYYLKSWSDVFDWLPVKSLHLEQRTVHVQGLTHRVMGCVKKESRQAVQFVLVHVVDFQNQHKCFAMPSTIGKHIAMEIPVRPAGISDTAPLKYYTKYCLERRHSQ